MAIVKRLLFLEFVYCRRTCLSEVIGAPSRPSDRMFPNTSDGFFMLLKPVFINGAAPKNYLFVGMS